MPKNKIINNKLNDYQRKLIEDNIKLVHYTMNKLSLFSKDPSIDRDDFFQIGCLGLINAALYYDDKKEIKFSSYAIPAIRNSILMAIRVLKRFNTLIQSDIIIDNEGKNISLLNFIEDELSLLEIENVSSLANVKELNNNIKNRINNLKGKKKTKDILFEMYNALLYYYENGQKINDAILSNIISYDLNKSYINRLRNKLKNITLEEYIKLNK